MFTTLPASQPLASQKRTLFWPRLLALSLLLLLGASAVFAQSTGFTYQGRLQDTGTPANGSYDLQFTLWDAVSGGTQQPQPTPVTVTRSAVSVANGIFTVQLDFGTSAFPGADRFLEIGVRPAGSGSLTILSPRQQISSTPYAVRSANAATADTATNATNATNSTELGGVAASQYVLTSDSRMSDARNPLPNSANYIQNTTSPQAGANFNIGASGTIGGNVGIGTPAPHGRLEVVGNGASVVVGDPNCGPGSTTVAIGLLTNASVDCRNNFNFGANTTLKQTVINRPTGGQISFREGNGPEQMSITPGGNVGIDRKSTRLNSSHT